MLSVLTVFSDTVSAGLSAAASEEEEEAGAELSAAASEEVELSDAASEDVEAELSAAASEEVVTGSFAASDVAAVLWGAVLPACVCAGSVPPLEEQPASPKTRTALKNSAVIL